MDPVSYVNSHIWGDRHQWPGDTNQMCVSQFLSLGLVVTWQPNLEARQACTDSDDWCCHLSLRSRRNTLLDICLLSLAVCPFVSMLQISVLHHVISPLLLLLLLGGSLDILAPQHTLTCSYYFYDVQSAGVEVRTQLLFFFFSLP